ncbi:MAG: VWA domain-containing protein [Vicinamibacterales bacterium]|jgi:Ca-activated chloride channel family protein|nr:VWA domain-containing protein [Vicinamibacterales bacterium]
MTRYLLGLLVTLGVATAIAQQPDQPAFRAGVDLVSLNVTVTDGDNRYVTDIEAEGFQLFEDGALQEVTFFNRTQLPIALALLIDTSASMTEKMPTAQEAAIGFAERLRAEDLASVIDFDSRVDILQDFTNSSDLLNTAIRRTSAGGSTSLYNAIYISLKELGKIGATTADEIRRQAIVMLSDGEDTSSLVEFEEVLELAKRSDTVIYSIGLRSRDIRTRRGLREADFVLRQLAQETGGRAFFPEQVEDLPEIYQRISDELSSQYTLGYISKNPLRNGQWRRIVVRVDRPNVAARTKQGYYGPTIN